MTGQSSAVNGCLQVAFPPLIRSARFLLSAPSKLTPSVASHDANPPPFPREVHDTMQQTQFLHSLAILFRFSCNTAKSMTPLHSIRASAICMVLAFGFSSAQAEAEPAVDTGLRVHNLYQSNMVIQRSKPVDVWGWSKPGDEVVVTFAGNTATGTADEAGKWTATLPAMEADSVPRT